MFYVNSKKLEHRGQVRKASSERVMQDCDWVKMLDACEASSGQNAKWQRDWAIIFLGCALGMRRGEVRLFKRKDFDDLQEHNVIHVPTLKQSERITYVCENKDCVTLKGKRTSYRLKASAAGEQHECSKCWTIGTVPKPKNKLVTGVVYRDVDVVEPKTVDFIFDYLDEQMRPDQTYLFEGRRGQPVSEGHVNCIFNTYCIKAEINPKLSFHSLRHNRGMKVYTMFHDFKAVQSALRQKDIKSAGWYATHDEEAKREMREALNAKAFDPLKRLKRKKVS